MTHSEMNIYIDDIIAFGYTPIEITFNSITGGTSSYPDNTIVTASIDISLSDIPSEISYHWLDGEIFILDPDDHYIVYREYTSGTCDYLTITATSDGGTVFATSDPLYVDVEICLMDYAHADTGETKESFTDTGEVITRFISDKGSVPVVTNYFTDMGLFITLTNIEDFGNNYITTVINIVNLIHNRIMRVK